MSLINCPECGKQITDKATNCIHCGAPINMDQDVEEDVVYSVDYLDDDAESGTGRKKYIADIIVVIVSLILLLLVGNSAGAYRDEMVKYTAYVIIISVSVVLIYLIHHSFRIGIRKEQIDTMTDSDCIKQMTHDLNVLKTLATIKITVTAQPFCHPEGTV